MNDINKHLNVDYRALGHTSIKQFLLSVRDDRKCPMQFNRHSFCTTSISMCSGGTHRNIFPIRHGLVAEIDTNSNTPLTWTPSPRISVVHVKSVEARKLVYLRSGSAQHKYYAGELINKNYMSRKCVRLDIFSVIQKWCFEKPDSVGETTSDMNMSHITHTWISRKRLTMYHVHVKRAAVSVKSVQMPK